jgi:hypothetical protein
MVHGKHKHLLLLRQAKQRDTPRRGFGDIYDSSDFALNYLRHAPRSISVRGDTQIELDENGGIVLRRCDALNWLSVYKRKRCAQDFVTFCDAPYRLFRCFDVEKPLYSVSDGYVVEGRVRVKSCQPVETLLPYGEGSIFRLQQSLL